MLANVICYSVLEYWPNVKYCLYQVVSFEEKKALSEWAFEPLRKCLKRLHRKVIWNMISCFYWSENICSPNCLYYVMFIWFYFWHCLFDTFHSYLSINKRFYSFFLKWWYPLQFFSYFFFVFNLLLEEPLTNSFFVHV